MLGNATNLVYSFEYFYDYSNIQQSPEEIPFISVTPHLSNPQTWRQSVCPAATEEPQVAPILPSGQWPVLLYTKHQEENEGTDTTQPSLHSDNEIGRKLIWKKFRGIT